MLRLVPAPVEPPPPDPVGRRFEVRKRGEKFDVWLHDGAARSNLSRAGIAPVFANRVQAEIWGRAYARDGGFKFEMVSKAKPPPTPDELIKIQIRHERFRVHYNDRKYREHRDGLRAGDDGKRDLRFKVSYREAAEAILASTIACAKLAELEPDQTRNLVACALSRLNETAETLDLLRRSLETVRILAGPDRAGRPTLLLDWKDWAVEP